MRWSTHARTVLLASCDLPRRRHLHVDCGGVGDTVVLKILIEVIDDGVEFLVFIIFIFLVGQLSFIRTFKGLVFMFVLLLKGCAARSATYISGSITSFSSVGCGTSCAARKNGPWWVSRGSGARELITHACCVGNLRKNRIPRSRWPGTLRHTDPRVKEVIQCFESRDGMNRHHEVSVGAGDLRRIIGNQLEAQLFAQHVVGIATGVFQGVMTDG
jgi:hypothetical protein